MSCLEKNTTCIWFNLVVWRKPQLVFVLNRLFGVEYILDISREESFDLWIYILIITQAA